MNILACESSTLVGSVAVYKSGQLFEKKIQRAGSHSETLNLMIQECLSDSGMTLNDIDLFVSGNGPGSFTGVRISLNTIKSFSYLAKKKCAALDTLRNIAEHNKEISPSVIVMLNAYKNMVYYAEYDFSSDDNTEPMLVHPPQVVRVQDLKNFLHQKALVVGDGYLDYQDFLNKNYSKLIRRDTQAIDYPSAGMACLYYSSPGHKSSRVLFDHYSELKPLYLRDSEAEENIKGIKYLPLI